MRVFPRLLAKRSATPDSPSRSESLPGHLEDVVAAAKAIVDVVGARCLSSLGLDGTFDVSSFERAVLRAAFLHDLGKANDHFQRMVRGGRAPQALRHEWISAWLLLRVEALDRWLFAGCSHVVRNAALFAALGHHLRVRDAGTLAPDETGASTMTVMCDHRDFPECLEVGRRLGLPEAPVLSRVSLDLLSRPLGELRTWLPRAGAWYRDAGRDTRQFVSAVKALVIAADAAGSALPRHSRDPGGWVREVLGRVAAESELAEVAVRRLNGQGPREFQRQVAQTASRVTFVAAGCGTGKTVAAYLWAAARAAGRKLFFCYPTTGTATEGFRGYIIPAEMTAAARLLHGRSEVDLEGVAGGPEDDSLDLSVRVESLAAWDVPLIVCTADQVLGLVQNNRRPLFGFAPLAAAAFVFDEIHQYDGHLFGALLRFLDSFRGAPTLLMTASLPEGRHRALERAVREAGNELAVVEGPPDVETIKRYRIVDLACVAPWNMVEQVLRDGGKVLWVANTVGRAVSFARDAKRRGLDEVLVYHSRFRYEDRLKKHNALVDAFAAPGPRPVLAVTTQVCEVSLDLSADLLVSDVAPVAALIQRLGRLNRRVTPDRPGRPAPAVMIEPRRPEPYEQEDLDTALRWLSGLGSGPLSQADLRAAFEKLEDGGPAEDVESAWLDGGPLSWPAPLREAGVTVPVILGEDGGRCVDRHGRPISSEVARCTIPMTLGPVAGEIRRWKLLGSGFVAPPARIEYSGEWGARWA